MTNSCRAACALLCLGIWFGAISGRAAAEATQETQASVTNSEIHAGSPPYHFDWNGSEGTFSQDALGVETARKVPVVFLHSEAGPKGYAKYLAWFLVRDGETFSILWCYLNDSGTDFYAYLYRYPVNQLVSLVFTGNYRFVAPAEPVAPHLAADLKTLSLPHYDGPDFVYGGWNRRSGTLSRLDLFTARAGASAVPLTARGADVGAVRGNGPAVKTLTNLRAYPLHEVYVPSGNGWRPEGWRELWALALDAANDPYFMILYSHQAQGFAVDLRRAETYVADYGQKVVFSQAPSTFGAEEQVTGPPDARVLRYTCQEIVFTATGSYTNPYNEVYLDLQLRSPDGKLLTVPGFWDGGQTWRARIAPIAVGKWTWRTVSSDPGMNRQEGGFTCISTPSEGRGFLAVNTNPAYRHSFANSDGSPFLPVFVAYPMHHIPVNQLSANQLKGASAPDKAASASDVVRLAVAAPSASDDSFARYQHDVDALSRMGFNRFIGEYLIDPVEFAAKNQHNEGGAPFVGFDADRINPAYFQAMDRRLTYANDKGVIPDIGIGLLDSNLMNLLDQAQVNRLWRYILARYSCYNVSWTPFGRAIGKPVPAEAATWIESIQKATRRNDPDLHPLTLVMAGGVETPAKPARPTVTASDQGAPEASSGVPTEDLAGHVNPAAPPAAIGGNVRIPEAQPIAPPAVGQTSAGQGATRVPNKSAASGKSVPTGKSTASRRAIASKNSGARKTRSAGGKGKSPSGAGVKGSAPAGPGLIIVPGGSSQNIRPGVPGRNAGAGQGVPPNGANPGAFPGPLPGGGNPGAFPGPPPGGVNGFPGAPQGGNPGAFPGFRPGGAANGFPGPPPGGLPGFGGPDMGQDPGAFFRGRNRGAGRTRTQEMVGNYIQSPSGLPLGPTTANASKSAGPKVTVEPAPSWLDVITFNGGPVGEVSAVYSNSKPVVIYDQSAPSEPGGARYRLWSMQMNGGYWAADYPASGQKSVVDSPETRWAANAGQLFAKTRYWRLVPHNDMLGGVEESAFERRRRRQAEEAAAKEAAAQDAAKGIEPDDNDPFGGDVPPPSGPIYVLADPGWEYVIYFQRGGMLTLDLLEATGRVSYVWFNPRSGEFSGSDTVMGGAFRSFRAPDDNDWALYISRR